MITLTRNTYQAKKQLANYGATYQSETKSWTMSESDWAEFKADYPILSREMAVGSTVTGDAGDINNLLRANGNSAASE